MNDMEKVIIEIPKKVFEARKTGEISPWVTVPILDAVQNGTPLDFIKAEIKKKCDRINTIFKSLASVTSYPQHREIQELLCEILASIDNAESKDPNDLTHIFDGVTEIPKDAFKGWTTEKLLEQIRKENNDNPKDTGCDHND